MVESIFSNLSKNSAQISNVLQPSMIQTQLQIKVINMLSSSMTENRMHIVVDLALLGQISGCMLFLLNSLTSYVSPLLFTL